MLVSLISGTCRSAAETRSLVEGVEMCGGGKWSEIKRLSLPNLAKRSTVDLKDKWRNLVRAAQLPNDQLMASPLQCS